MLMNIRAIFSNSDVIFTTLPHQKEKYPRGAKRRNEADEKMSPEDGLKIFKTMENTMLHEQHCHGKEKYPSVTYGMFRVHGGEISTFFEKDATHVEVKVSQILECWISEGKLKGPKTVTIYLNWSPCPSCVDTLLNLLKWSQHKGSPLRLVVKCVALCMITWPECENKGCSHLTFARHKDDFKKGILKLMQGGVAVEAFKPGDWAMVKQRLGLPLRESPRSNARKMTDEMVRKSLLALEGRIGKSKN